MTSSELAAAAAHPKRLLLLALAGLFLPLAAARATGGFDDEPPFSLPYYLDRLPAKSPALIFQETFNGGATSAATPVDFKAALLALAAECEAGRPSATLVASIDDLLSQARLDPWRAAVLCNVLNDVRDLFSASPPVTGKPAAGYICWRVEHAAWFGLSWDAKKPLDPAGGALEDDEARGDRKEQHAKILEKLAASPASGAVAVHWLYLCAANEYPGGGTERFQAVVDKYPEHPRAEAARFMLARCRLQASHRHGDGWSEPNPEQAAAAAKDRADARSLFEDYLKRYPKGRFAADIPGWLGAIAFGEKDYLGALDNYLQQADLPGHPEVLKSAGFMCERCLSHLAGPGDQAALERVAAHPRLAMSLIYLLVNTPESDNYDGNRDDPAQVSRWRKALLPRLADAVAAHKDAYESSAWQPRYLAILAQAASGAGDQDRALALCELAKDQFAQSDDLAFVRLVALGRARRLPEAIAAGREFARVFPQSVLTPGAALRLALALQDDHQAGAAVGELHRLIAVLKTRAKGAGGDDFWMSDRDRFETVYPTADGDLSVTSSVLRADTSGADADQLLQINDALLNFAPLPELAAALAPPLASAAVPAGGTGLDGEGEAHLRAVLVQRWLAEQENFGEARKYATPAQWGLTAAGLEKLAAEAAAAKPGEKRANAYARLADAWSAARGRLLFAPLETDQTRQTLFAGDNEAAGTRRRENGLALGYSADQIDHALLARDEWRHASDWWLKTADAAPAASPLRAKARWSALRALPAITFNSPYTFLRAGETDATGFSRKLYDRLKSECPDSPEARDLAVYYDLAPPPGEKAADDTKPAEPNLSKALAGETLPIDEPEYRWDVVAGIPKAPTDEFSQDNPANGFTKEALALRTGTRDPQRLGRLVADLRKRVHAGHLDRDDLFLVNFLDDLGDFLREPAAKLTPTAVGRYLELRTECLNVEFWGFNDILPPVPGAPEGHVDDTVLGHIRGAYREPAMAPFKDYLDFLAMAVVANHAVRITVPGETEPGKDSDDPTKKEPVTYRGRDYPKLAKLTEGFLADYPHSRKREAVRLLYARALYAASRPRVRAKFVVWPESGHFASGTIIATHRQQPLDAKEVGAALNAYDREFPQGRYAAEIRNLRGLLAWHTQDWQLAFDLTLKTLADARETVLQDDAAHRLANMYIDGLTDETERAHCLAAIKARPDLIDKLKKFLPGSPYPLQAIRSWVSAQL